MINIYIAVFQALFCVWVVCAILGLTTREASAYAGLLIIPFIVHTISTRFIEKEYTPLKRVTPNIDEIVLFVFFQVAILYIISPFRTNTKIEALLFLCGVYELGSLFSVHDRFKSSVLATMWLCGSVTIISAVLYGSAITEYSPGIVIPCLVYSTYLANSITLENVENLEELQELL